jgi:hypothetical protein
LWIRARGDLFSFNFVSSLVMTLVVVVDVFFMIVRRIPQHEHVIGDRHSLMCTRQPYRISMNFCLVAFDVPHLRQAFGCVAPASMFPNPMGFSSPLGTRGGCRSHGLLYVRTGDGQRLSRWYPERALCFSHSGRTLKYLLRKVL